MYLTNKELKIERRATIKHVCDVITKAYVKVSHNWQGGGKRTVEKMSEEQLQALKTLYKIIAEAYQEVVSSEAAEVIEGSKAEETVATWALETNNMLSMLDIQFGLES